MIRSAALQGSSQCRHDHRARQRTLCALLVSYAGGAASVFPQVRTVRGYSQDPPAD
ncbi:MAG: hypothetical protein J0H57_14880 [Rhodospirillales bacterium]|nr:hypothetical protein [Rhodospirillales bacterium]